MISFVWPPGEPMLAGTGGSETYTAGHVRELLRRGIDAQVVTVGHGKKDGRQDFKDIPLRPEIKHRLYFTAQFQRLRIEINIKNTLLAKRLLRRVSIAGNNGHFFLTYPIAK